MKHIEHPETLFIQIQDEGGENIGIAFNESPNDVDNCDFYDFDNETRERILHILLTAYKFISDHKEKLTEGDASHDK